MPRTNGLTDAPLTAFGFPEELRPEDREFQRPPRRVRARYRDDSGTGILLTGRSEGFIVGRPDLAIRRLTAYAEAGADCLYAPGIRTKSDIAAVVGEGAPKPVNVLAGRDLSTIAELAHAGVRLL